MSLQFSRPLLKAKPPLLVLVLLASGVSAQTRGDSCHVYVVDIAKAKRALSTADKAEGDAAIAKALSMGQTIFPEFMPTLGEEELTTKHYPFPGSTQVITASVFYTDESMASHGEGAAATHNDSMIVGVIVSNGRKASAIDPETGAAITEVTYDQYTNKVRAKQYVMVRGRMFLVGIERDCMVNKKSR